MKKPTAFKSLVLGLMLIFLSADLARATTVERLSLESLVKKASSIVQGKVDRSKTFWSADRKVILTTYTIIVDETIKGTPARAIELTTIGGTMGDVTLHVAGMPTFQQGENAVVFVEKSGNFSTVVGLAQGHFVVENAAVSNRVSELQFPDGRPGSSLKMSLQSFKNQIRALID
jgi:hypothetical protein